MEQLSEQEADRLSSSQLAGREIVVAGEPYILHAPVGRGRKGVVWRAANSLGATRAIKFALAADYDTKTPTAELSRASTLEAYPQFARLERVERLRFEDLQVVALVSEWISGTTLEALLESQPERSSADLIRGYVAAIADALGALSANGLCHDDLNFGNVMLVDPLPGLRSTDITFKVIDLGSLKFKLDHDATKKQGIDDHRWVALHLAALHNAAKRRFDLSPRERTFLRHLRPIVQQLLEVDPVKRVTDPGTIQDLVESAWRRSAPNTPARITSPFEYLSADQIADDAILLRLFADSLPWLEQVNSSTPQILTGPRGCGKSTVFRWLALRTHIPRMGAGGAEESSSPRISGFYISAGVELQSRLSWITDHDVAGRLRQDIIHLFNLVVAREIVKTLAMSGELSQDIEGLTPSKAVAQAILAHVEENYLFEKVPLFAGINPLRQISRELNHHIFETHERLIRRSEIDVQRSTPATLPAFTELLISLVPHFGQFPIVFLIDDFSTHRVPAPVQEILHDVIWLRPRTHTFKVSAEKNGVHRSTAAGRTAEIAREFREVDCGSIMLEDSSSKAIHKFAVQLLDTRLKACDYKGTALSLLGESLWDVEDTKTNLSQFLWQYAHSGKGKQKPAAYYGTQCIADLCSGDVAALLLIYESIFRSASVTRNTTKAIPRSHQDKAIVSVSRQLVTQLRDYHGVGAQLHSFTDRFGVFIAEMLRNAPPQGADQEPVQIPRIEVDGYSQALQTIEKDARASRVYDELIRRAVLIDIRPGSGRRMHTTTLRLHLRKIFLPAFGAALGKNRALVLRPEEFVFALCEPEEAFGSFLRRYGGVRADEDRLFELDQPGTR